MRRPGREVRPLVGPEPATIPGASTVERQETVCSSGISRTAAGNPAPRP